MFKELKHKTNLPKPIPVPIDKLDTSFLTTATEALATMADEPVPTDPGNDSDNDKPVEKYGATPIVLNYGNPEKPYVIETQKEGGACDYAIYMMYEIYEYNPDYLADVLAILNYATESTKITIYINSPGGTLQCACSLISAMRNSKATVRTVAIGECASAAALIWCAGDIKEIREGAYIMIHMATHGDYGLSNEIATVAEFTVRYVKEICINPAIKDGVLTQEDADNLVDKRLDIYIDSYEMQKRLTAASTPDDGSTV